MVVSVTHAAPLRGGVSEEFLLALALADGTVAAQDGRTARLTRGDFAVVDGARPFAIDGDPATEWIALTIPRRQLAARLAAPADVTAVRIAGDRGTGAVAAAAVHAFATADAPDAPAGEALTDHLAGLIGLALDGAVRPREAGRRQRHLQAVLDEADRALDDPGLSPATVAARVGISTRYLHALFAEREETFGRWVLAGRLERGHRDLVDPARRHWTVSEIATDRGFRDPSYFARAFRARYGVSPRDHRRRG
jgi:AraC-like DNA-binding protein